MIHKIFRTTAMLKRILFTQGEDILSDFTHFSDPRVGILTKCPTYMPGVLLELLLDIDRCIKLEKKRSFVELEIIQESNGTKQQAFNYLVHRDCHWLILK